MKKLCFLAFALAMGIGGAVRADDGPPIPLGSLGSGANLGQVLPNLGFPSLPGTSPFSNGLGQIVSDWAQQGITGQQLAGRIHWLQQMRADEMAQRTRWLDQRRFDRDNWSRDIREDRREILDDERRLREDQQRLARDREDLQNDLRDQNERLRDQNRDDRFRDWDRNDRFRDHHDNGLHRGWRGRGKK